MSMENYNFVKAREAWGRPTPYTGEPMIKPDPVQTQEPPIVYEANILEKNLVYMEECIAQLESRLHPILSVPMPEKESLARDSSGSSALIKTLNSFNNIVVRMTSQINDIKARLEV